MSMTATRKWWDEVDAAKMKAAFDAVCDPADWRAPIDATIDMATVAYDVATICEAVSFFTATEATATPMGGTKFRFRAKGYRAGPAGP